MLDYLSRLWHRVKYMYFLYELNTQISICEPWEKTFINCLFLVVFAVIGFACYAYLPGYVRTLVYFITPVRVMEQFWSPDTIDKTAFVDHAAEYVKEL